MSLLSDQSRWKGGSDMKFEAKTCKRLCAIAGGIAGIFAMMIAVCLHQNLAGAIMLTGFAGIGSTIGTIIEKKKENSTVVNWQKPKGDDCA